MGALVVAIIGYQQARRYARLEYRLRRVERLEKLGCLRVGCHKAAILWRQAKISVLSILVRRTCLEQYGVVSRQGKAEGA
jgi:hypothetical protein